MTKTILRRLSQWSSLSTRSCNAFSFFFFYSSSPVNTTTRRVTTQQRAIHVHTSTRPIAHYRATFTIVGHSVFDNIRHQGRSQLQHGYHSTEQRGPHALLDPFSNRRGVLLKARLRLPPTPHQAHHRLLCRLPLRLRRLPLRLHWLHLRPLRPLRSLLRSPLRPLKLSLRPRHQVLLRQNHKLPPRRPL